MLNIYIKENTDGLFKFHLIDDAGAIIASHENYYATEETCLAAAQFALKGLQAAKVEITDLTGDDDANSHEWTQ